MQVLYTLVWEYFHKLYNFQIRGEIVDNMIDEIEKLKLVIHVNEKEIKDIKLKCQKFEQEKRNAMNDLKDTQVMSNDQLEKLYNLEKKQDLLEVENSRIKECLKQSDENNKELTKNINTLRAQMTKLDSENEVVRSEIYIQELIDEMEEVNSVYKEFSNFEKITKDWEY